LGYEPNELPTALPRDLKCKYSKLSLLRAKAFDLSTYLCRNVL